MTIVCEPNGQTAAAMLARLGTAAHAVPTMEEAVQVIEADPHENLLAVGPDLPLDLVVNVTRHLRATRPELAVVLVRWSVDPATTQTTAAERIDVIAVEEEQRLIDYGTAAGRHAAVEDHSSPEADHRGEVVTVFAAKGGCGKTTLATNLAVTLSASGKHRVCLVDLDLDFGDVAISLQLTPKRTLIDAADPEFISRFADDHSRFEGLTVSYGPGFDCVLAPAEPGEGDRVSPQLVTTLLNDLRSSYDYIVVDTPAHFSEHVLAALDNTDHYVLITTPELPSLKNLRLTLDMFDLLGYERGRRHIVFNRSDDQTGLTAADIERTVRAPITAHIPSSRDVPVSINKGVPLAQSQPKHAFSNAVRVLVATAIAQEAKGSSSSRLFGRRKPVRN